jgi:U3 small nucleolar RNA-associated protein 8
MSLSQLYALSKFPRVSNVSERAKVARNTSDEELFIAISGASLSHFVLKPSPKLVWSHSFPPGFTVAAVEKVDESFVIGVWNKSSKKHLIQVIQKEENGSSVVKEWEMTSKVLEIRYSYGKIIVVTADSTICYSREYIPVWTVDALYTTVYAELIENDVVLLVEHHNVKNNLHFRLLSSESHEISSKIVESQSLKNLQFTYRDGVVIQFANDEFTMYKIPHFTAFKTLTLNQLDITPKSNEKITFLSPAKDRLIIAQGHDLYFVNTNFSIVLSSINFAKSALELLYVQAPVSNRPSQQLFGVVLKEHELSGVTFTLDTNTLKDSLGKKKQQHSKTFIAVPSILEIEDKDVNVDEILCSKDFDSSLLEFLQAENDYYTEKDKVVDSKFMLAVVEHVFQSKNIPKRAMTYLLTHPLFPAVPDLLAKLRQRPRLLRQAIVTGNVSVRELINELNTTENEDIFKDIITRLLEFPKEKLDFKDLDSFKIVERIVQLNFGYELISLLIDASGLFTWNEEFVTKLQQVLNRKIEALNSASNVLAVLDQIETKSLKTVARVPVYSIEKLVI